MKGQVLTGEVEELQVAVKLNRQQARSAESTARQAVAGVTANQKKLSTLNDRFSMLDEYDLYKTLTVHFPFDSSVIQEAMQSGIDRFISGIDGLTGYLVEIQGFASTDGDEAYNRQLSQRRANSVRQYVTEKHQMHLRRFVAHLVGRAPAPLEVEAPEVIEMAAAYRPSGELMIHLLNNPLPIVPWKIEGTREDYDENQGLFHAPFEVNPIHDIAIRFIGLKVKSARLPLQATNLAVSGATPTVVVPKVDLHEVVLVELDR